MLKAPLVFWFLCLWFFLSGCPARHYVQKQNPAAKQQIPAQYLWDFGKAEAGEILKHEFIFKNESSETLNIREVSTSCGCTVSQVKKKTLLPGESTAIEVSFNTKGYSGPTQQFVYVNTDNLDNPIIKFIIKADVVQQ